jgi:hypothetical protein
LVSIAQWLRFAVLPRRTIPTFPIFEGQNMYCYLCASIIYKYMQGM